MRRAMPTKALSVVLRHKWLVRRCTMIPPCPVVRFGASSAAMLQDQLAFVALDISCCLIGKTRLVRGREAVITAP